MGEEDFFLDVYQKKNNVLDNHISLILVLSETNALFVW